MQTWSNRKAHGRAQRARTDGLFECRTCRQVLVRNSSNFGRDPRMFDQLRAMCRVCAVAASRRCHAKQRYGVTPEDIAAALAAQLGACAICDICLDGASKATKPHVDHDHKTGRMRALLCHHCNVLLGHAKENTALLRRAADYLSGVHDSANKNRLCH